MNTLSIKKGAGKKAAPVRESSPKPTSENVPKLVRCPQKLMYALLAGLFFVLGMVGLLLPLVPTTPFLLLMSYFLIRVSRRAHDFVISWPIVGRPIHEWEEHRGVRPGTKRTAYISVAIFLTVSLTIKQFSWSFVFLAIVLASAGIYVVFRLPTIRD